MPQPRIQTGTAIAFLVVLTFSPALAQAQPLWLDRSHDRVISLEILKPDFDGDDQFTFATSALFLSLRYPATENVRLVAEVPFAHGGVDSPFGGTESSNTLGNPYLGIETHQPGSPSFAEFGVRLPLMKEFGDDDFATGIGAFSDIDRWDAFAEDVLSVTGLVNFRHRSPEGTVVHARGGPILWVITENRDFRDDAELWLVYSLQFGYEASQASVLVGVVGRLLATESDLSFGERTLHQFGLSGSVDLGGVLPGAHIRIPLDKDLTDILDVVLGVNLAIEVR